MRCAVAVAVVRAEPDLAAEQVTQLLLGEPVRVEARRGDWVRVLTAYDYPGWVCAEALEAGEGSAPEVEFADPVAAARSYLGSRYEWGGLTAAGIDCSGLVHMAYRRSGRLVPRDARQQEAAGRQVSPGEARPGDLLTYGGGAADHIAFCLGEGRILHSSGGAGVVEEPEPAALSRRRRRRVSL